MTLVHHESPTFYKGVSRDFKSPYRTEGKLTYTPGSTVVAPSVNPSRASCAEGINFVDSIHEALNWGPTVVEIIVPEGVIAYDRGRKLRAREVRVGRVISLRGISLQYARFDSSEHLQGQDFTGSDFAGAMMGHMHLRAMDLTGTFFSSAILRNATFDGCNLGDADFYNADLREVSFKNCTDLSTAMFNGSRVENVSVDGRPVRVENSRIILL